jgi:hypothetical protein
MADSAACSLGLYRQSQLDRLGQRKQQRRGRAVGGCARSEPHRAVSRARRADFLRGGAGRCRRGGRGALVRGGRHGREKPGPLGGGEVGLQGRREIDQGAAMPTPWNQTERQANAEERGRERSDQRASFARRMHRLTFVRARSDRCAAGRRLRVRRLIPGIGTTVARTSIVLVCPSRTDFDCPGGPGVKSQRFVTRRKGLAAGVALFAWQVSYHLPNLRPAARTLSSLPPSAHGASRPRRPQCHAEVLLHAGLRTTVSSGSSAV